MNSNRRLRQSWCRATIFVAAIASVCGPRAAEAQTRRTWNVGSGTWATTGNWLGGSVPTSSEIGTFSSMPFSTTNVAALLNADTSVGGLSFNSFGTTTLRSDSATARLLTLGTSGISMGGTAGAVTLGVSGSAVNLVLNGTQTWTNNSRAFPLTVVGTINTAGSVGSDLTITGSNNTAISGVISGAAGRVISLVKSGAGMLSLSGANTFTGGVTLNSGTLTVNNASALGTGTVTINGGVVQNIASWSTNNPQSWSGDFSVGSTGNTNLGAGAVTMIGNRVITALFSPGSSMSGVTNLSGVISGTGSLTKSGSGAVQINANNTFSGGFTLNSGTVSIGGVTAPFGTGRLTINGGAIDNQNNLLGGWSTIPQTWNGDWIYVSVNSLNTGTAAITLGGSRNVTAVAPGNNILAFNGPIGDGGNGFGFTKSGTGQIDLGAANTYTGATTVNAGTLRLDFSSANAPANNILGTAGTLVMGGGILQVTGRGGASAQTLAGLTLNPGGSAISLTSSGGNTLRLSVGEITRR